MDNRMVIAIVVIAVVVISIVGFTINSILPQFISSDEPENSESDPIDADTARLIKIASSILGAGPPPDGIPPIENPQFWNTLEEVDVFLLPSDIVIGFVDYEGIPKAYPQRILVWHEIVNEAGGISITYCPLTGSAIGFNNHFNGVESTFGTSGKLVNSNLVMYDRDSNSFFPQILGRAVTGDQFGTKLEKIQVYWTTWELWKTKYPDTLVLNQDTQFTRNYDRDPYGQSFTYQSYNSIQYYKSGDLLFPVMHQDTRLATKTIVSGIDYNSTQIAIDKDHLQQEQVINIEINGTSIVAFFDTSLNVARIFSRVIDDILLEFNYDTTTGIISDNTGKIWTVDGINSENNIKLNPIVYMDVFWGAWVGFFPNTELIMEKG